MSDTTHLLDPVWTLGDRFRRARAIAGLTPAEMAARLKELGVEKVTRSTVSAWENNANKPRDLIGTARCYVEITDDPRVSVDWLLDLGRTPSAWTDVTAGHVTLDLALEELREEQELQELGRAFSHAA